MTQWHCSINGQQYGPVDEAKIRQWAVEGRLRPADLVWWEGQSQWCAASSVPNLFDGAPPPAPMGVPVAYSAVAPHRGGLILTLGILGIVICAICGIVAWVMGNADMRAIRAGQMDPAGEGLTQAGRILGMIATILMIVGVCIWVILMIAAVGANV